jgi:hypothetical protein
MLYGTAVAAALSITLAGHFLVSSLAYERRLYMQHEVLTNRAYLPYQYSMYTVAQVCDFLARVTGRMPLHAFTAVFGFSYLLLFVSLTWLLLRIYRRPGPVVLGIWATAAYAAFLMPYAFDHPSDVLGAALLVLSLCGLQAQSPVLMVASCAAAGFFWPKHVLMAPVAFVHYARAGNWRSGVVVAVLAGLAAGVGWSYLRFILGPHPVVPDGIFSPHAWLAALPRGVLYQAGFAAPALMAYGAFRKRLKPLVCSAALLYPLMLMVYTVQRYPLSELRSFWIVVPAFVLLLAAWASDGSGDCAEPY